MTNDTPNLAGRTRDESSFKRLATKRVNAALKIFKLIGNLSNKSNYSYTDKQVKAIFDALESGLNDMKKEFERRQKITRRFEL